MTDGSTSFSRSNRVTVRPLGSVSDDDRAMRSDRVLRPRQLLHLTLRRRSRECLSRRRARRATLQTDEWPCRRSD